MSNVSSQKNMPHFILSTNHGTMVAGNWAESGSLFSLFKSFSTDMFSAGLGRQLVAGFQSN